MYVVNPPTVFELDKFNDSEVLAHCGVEAVMLAVGIGTKTTVVLEVMVLQEGVETA